jgi:hypothetical protein
MIVDLYIFSFTEKSCMKTITGFLLGSLHSSDDPAIIVINNNNYLEA